MKTVKAICTAVILALALSIPIYGGDIGSPGIRAAAVECDTPTDSIPGDIGSPGMTSPRDGGSLKFVDILMNLLAMLP